MGTSNRHQIFNFNDQQHGTPPAGFTSTPATDFAKDADHPSGTKKWLCDADKVTINTKWFPSSTSGWIYTGRLLWHEKVAVISKTMSDIKEQSCNSLRALGDTVKRKTMERLSMLGGG